MRHDVVRMLGSVLILNKLMASCMKLSRIMSMSMLLFSNMRSKLIMALDSLRIHKSRLLFLNPLFKVGYQFGTLFVIYLYCVGLDD